VEINKSAWHAKAFFSTWKNLHRGHMFDTKCDHVSLCIYFWMIALSPLNWCLWSFIPWFFNSTTKKLICWGLLLSLPLYSPKLLWIYRSLIVIIIGTFTVVLGAFAVKEFIIDKRFSKETLYLVKSYLRAKKQKVCPIIQFKEVKE